MEQIIKIVLEDQGGGVIGWNFNECAPTLRASMAGHPPVVVLDEDFDREEIL